MTLVLGISTNLLNDALDKTLGECFEALPWTERFNGSTFVTKCSGGIAPKRLEVDGAYESSPKRIDCTQLHGIRLEIFLMGHTLACLGRHRRGRFFYFQYRLLDAYSWGSLVATTS